MFTFMHLNFEGNHSNLRLTLIWVGLLEVRFEVGGGGVKLPQLCKTCYNYARNFKFGT